MTTLFRDARQVEPRNTPTTINAAFNVRQFWDGRANHLFNDVGVFGLREIEADPDQRLTIASNDGTPELGFLQLEDASLASQAVGPPLNPIEMSCRDAALATAGQVVSTWWCGNGGGAVSSVPAR